MGDCSHLLAFSADHRLAVPSLIRELKRQRRCRRRDSKIVIRGRCRSFAARLNRTRRIRRAAGALSPVAHPIGGRAMRPKERRTVSSMLCLGVVVLIAGRAGAQGIPALTGLRGVPGLSGGLTAPLTSLAGGTSTLPVVPAVSAL